jgi:hypothetical protein
MAILERRLLVRSQQCWRCWNRQRRRRHLANFGFAAEMLFQQTRRVY